MTKNIVVQKASTIDFEKELNKINQEYGRKVFATQTHVTLHNGNLIYTAVLFIREE